MKLKSITFCLIASSLLNAAILWENNLPAALNMYNFSGADSVKVTGENAITFVPRKGYAVFTRKNVNFSAENNLLELDLKVPSGSRIIFCYYTTETNPEFSEDKKLAVYFRGSGEWQTVKADFSKQAKWQGKITGFRLDFFAPSGSTLLWRSAKFTNPDEKPAEWNFSLPESKAWNWRHGLTVPASLQNGAMILNFKDKYSISPTIPVKLDCKTYGTMIIRAKTDKPGKYSLIIYFSTQADNILSERQKIVLTLNLTDKYQDFRLPLGKYSTWKGIVTGFRMDITAPSTADKCKLEIAEITFSSLKNLAGTLRSGKKFGPFYHLVPDKDYELNFSSNSPAKGELLIENPYGQYIEKLPVNIQNGKNRFRFTLKGNGASLFFSADAPLQNFCIIPQNENKKDRWHGAFWIADAENFYKRGPQYFQKEIVLDSQPLDCRFQGTGDDRFSLYINGKKVTIEDLSWQNPRVADVTHLFKKGKNLISISLYNNGEASGILANFFITDAAGRTYSINTDNSFRTLRNPENDWKNRLYGINESFAPKLIGNYLALPWGSWCLMEYNHFVKRDQFKAENTVLTPIKGGVHIKMTLSAQMLAAPREKISACAIASGTVIAEDEIILPTKITQGKTVEISQNLFAGKLLCDNYTLELSGENTRADTGKILTFTVKENPDLKPNLVSEVRPSVNGPIIYINDKPFNEMVFTSRVMQSIKEHYDTGYRYFIVSVGTNVGRGLTTPGWNPEGYDFTFARRKLNRLVASFPEIRLIVTFGIDAPYWWYEKYPDQAIYLDGKSKHENLASPASAQWLKDGASFIRSFIRCVENSPLRSNVAGYRLASLCDGGEWQYPGVWATAGNPPRHADFSTAMQNYFRRFLKQKYGSNFDSSKITVPHGKERLMSSDTWFRDPEKEQLIIDYIECQSDAVATAAIHFLKAAKAEAKNKIVGIYGGYLLFYSGHTVQNIGHLAFRKIYESGAADFFSGPIDYHLRKLGLPGGNMASVSSLKLHGATYFQENDTRTFLNESPSHRHVNNLYESTSVLLRDSAIGMVTSTPIYTCDLTGNSYRNQGLVDAGKLLNDAFKHNFNPTCVHKPDVALLYSIDSLPYLVEKNHEITNASSYLLRINTGKSGAQCDAYLLEDILSDKFPVKQYKCFVIVNGFYLKPDIRKAIEEKLCKNNAVIVFTPGAGIIHNGKLSMENMENLTGLKFEKTDKKMPFAPGEIISGKPYAVKNAQNHKKVYTATTELTPDIYREIFASAGAHIWIKSNDTVTANGQCGFIHAAKAGEKEVFLPFAAEVTDLLTGRKIPTHNGNRSFKAYLRQHETRLYQFNKIK